MNETASKTGRPAKLRRDRKFRPCAKEPGDELYPNGIFVFNVTRLIEFIETHPQNFPIGSVAVADIPNYGGDEHLDQEVIRSALLSRPILLAEISPGRYSVIDGHHRVARARREYISTLPVHRVPCPQHIPFLTSMKAYECYIEYWNSKVKDWSPPQLAEPALWDTMSGL